MRILTLKRVSVTDGGTPGVLLDDKTPITVTLERPWLDNKPDLSSIPPGEYVAQRGLHTLDGHTFETFEITGVPFRSGVLLHRGNYYTDSKGCILLGSSFGFQRGMLCIEGSGDAFGKFMTRLAGEDQFKFVVVEV